MLNQDTLLVKIGHTGDGEGHERIDVEVSVEKIKNLCDADFDELIKTFEKAISSCTVLRYPKVKCYEMDLEESKFVIPSINKQLLEYVDGTPDKNYPLRILQAYRQKCDCYWEVSGLKDSTKSIFDLMNQDQKERAKILDRAINQLRNDMIFNKDV